MVEEKREKFSSIFDAVSKLERKKAVEKALSEQPQHEKKALSDEEIKEGMDKIQKLHNLLAESLEQVYVKSNLSPRKVRDYFNTAKNFSDAEWRLIQNEKQNIEEMLDRLVPSRHHKPTEAELKEEKAKQKRPTKMQVKSRWMPMH
jgi:hypothetical protein